MNKVQRFAVLGFLLVMTVTLSGCFSKQNASGVKGFFDHFKGYEAQVKVTLLKESKPNVLKMKQKAQLKGNYEYTLEEPAHLKGLCVTYDGKTITQYHPATGNQVACEPSQARQEMLLTSFVERYQEAKEVKRDTIKQDGKTIVTIEMPIEGDYKYMAKEKLYLDEERLLPIQMIIYDEKDSITIQVDYESFKYND